METSNTTRNCKFHSFCSAHSFYTVSYTHLDVYKRQLQDGGTGIVSSLDYGVGESFSIGAQAGYLLGVKEIAGVKPDFGDRFDVKLRLNANLGSVLKLPSNVDVYPGLNLGLKNFGGHLGARYFFDKGFGLFTEMQFPIAKYKKSEISFDDLNNQFSFNVGVSFDISK